MNKTGLLIGAVAGISFFAGTLFCSIANTDMVAVANFNHEQCQYPNRSTNPPDGCDNSDPCDPSNVKGGDGSCSPMFIQPSEQIQPVVTPVETKSEPICK